MPLITNDDMIQHANTDEVSDPSAYPRVPLQGSPPDRERPLLLSGMTHTVQEAPTG